MIRSSRRYVPATALALLATLVLAACGSSDSSDSSSGGSTTASSGGGDASAGYMKAQADFKKFQTAQGFDTVKPIGKPIPKGKTIDMVVCAPAACQPPGTFTKAAAAKVGWNVKVINAGATPETTKAAMDQAIRDNPDAVVFEGLDSSVFQAELAQLKAKKIPVVGWQTTDTNDAPNLFVVPGPSHYELLTQAAAAAAMVAGKGKPVIGHIAVPTFPIYKNTIDPKFNAAVKGYCPDCKIKTFDMPATSIGKDSATRIVNFLRANKDINVLVHDQDATALGLTPALKGASITGVQNVGIYPTAANLPNLQDGSEFALLPDPFVEMGYQVVDALARVFTDQSPQATIDQTTPVVIWTKDNAPQANGNNLPATQTGFEDKFLTAWGVTK
jgi:ABC-type sugar transport system substrate-binding protein